MMTANTRKPTQEGLTSQRHSQTLQGQPGAIGADGQPSATDPEAVAPPKVPAEFERIWERVQKRLRTQLGEDVYSSWFASAKLEQVTSSQIIISVATRFLKHWVENHFGAKLLHLFAVEAAEAEKAAPDGGSLDLSASLTRTISIRVRTTSPRVRPALSVPSPKDTTKPAVGLQRLQRTSRPGASSAAVSSGGGLSRSNKTDTMGHGAANLNTKSDTSKGQQAFAHPAFGGNGHGGGSSTTASASGSALDPRYTFDAFAVGDSNQFAFRAASELAEQRSVLGCRLLYIRGGVGLGKTHLCQAIAHRLCQDGFNTLYLTAEKFMRDFVISLRSRSAVDYKEALSSIDCLVVDDIQFLSGDTIQGEFCHVINTLIETGKTLVVASDRAPAALDSIGARMQSRLSSGLVVEISTMDRQVRRALLDWRRDTYLKDGGRADVTDGVLDKVADLITTNGRDLDGAFNRIIAEIGLNNVPVTEQSVAACIGFLLTPTEQPRVKIEDIQRATALQFGLTKTDLLSARRTKQIVGPRQIAMYLSKTMTVRSLPDIGRRFGGRDHTTVLHAVRKIEKEMESDPSLQKTIEVLKSAILSES
ncbi:MAG: chromosomal replication initiator protein DnaA [Pseudomonadota bacterium]